MSRFSRLNNYIKLNFYLDLRSLALFRIAIGIVAVPYILFIWTQANIFFGADGVIKSSRAWQISKSAPIFSVLYWSENPWVLHFVMALLLVSVICYLIGYRASLFALLAWFLICCLRARNPYPWHAGDVLMRMSFFWSFFLPVDERFSLSSLKKIKKPNYYLSVVSIAIFFQFFIEYFIAGIAKIGPIWANGYGVYFALQLSIFKTVFGAYFSSIDISWLKVLSYLTLFTEIFVPFLLFFPNKKGITRTVFFSFFLVFHLFIALFLNIDVFPYVSIAFLLILLPSNFWDKIALNVSAIKIRQIPKVSIAYITFIIAFIVFMNFYGLYFHATQKDKSELYYKFRTAEVRFGVDQEWKLFSFGRERPINFWFKIQGQKEDGNYIDVFRDGKKPLDEAPINPLDGFRNVMWGKYFQTLERGSIRLVGYSLSNYLCKEWNSSHPNNQVLNVKSTLMYQVLPFPKEQTDFIPWSDAFAHVDCKSGDPIPPTKE